MLAKVALNMVYYRCEYQSKCSVSSVCAVTVVLNECVAFVKYYNMEYYTAFGGDICVALYVEILMRDVFYLQ